MRTECWRQTILPLESQKTYANPFLDVSISGVFTSPSGSEIRREAYWDGGSSYRISFAPTQIGIWQYRIEAPEETGLNGKSGTIECVPYSGSLPIYKHGFLKTEPGKRYLMHNDGTPFFWLGDTHWDFSGRERWDESNHPAMTSMFRGMADRRIEQGYNVYQTNLRGEDIIDGVCPYWVSGREDDLPNMEFYQNELDRRMQYLADLGFVNALGFGWFGAVGNDGENKEHVKHLVRYIIARYGALPMVWILCGEVAGYFPGPQREKFLSYWREIAHYVEQLDGYNNLQTAHAWSELPYSAYYDEEDWFDFTLNQAGHGNLPIHFSNYRSWFEEHPNKPFVEGEAMYELCSTLETNGTRMCGDDLVRRTAYTVMQCGACGYTYGAQGIWDSVWDENDIRPWAGTFNRFGATWTMAIDAPGGKQMGYLKNFYIQQHFENLIPDINPKRDFGYGARNQRLVLANPERTQFVIYYANSPGDGCIIDSMQPGEYEVQWFDPRTGTYQPGVGFTTEDGSWTSPAPLNFEDWLLVAVRK